jgi:amino acid adenylation domain-containing protein
MEKLFRQFNDTECDFDNNITMQELFELRADRTPDAIAVLFGNETLTYKQLNARVNALAYHLRGMGLVREEIVGILCERSFEMMVGILGIIKAGGAYLPLSPADPEHRVNRIIEDSRLNILLVQRKFNRNTDFKGSIVEIDDFKGTGIFPNPQLINKSTDLLYVIYTSGSTGIPKGVMIEHRSVINRLTWMQKAYPIDKDDIILQKTPFNFDVSVWELFWWFMEGAKLYFLAPGSEKNPIALISTIEEQRISVLHFVPPLLGVLLEYVHEKKVAAKLTSLRLIFSSGEALPAKYVNQFNQILNRRHDKRLINLYGPTEATVDVTHYDCSAGGINDKIPIGKPISNTQIFIVDEHDSLLEPGMAGELLIGGIGVARGYLNRVELTADRFIDNPFTRTGKIYKTGDLARWFEDGNIEYLDRIDHQVKIRGIRIELGEIEATLSKHLLIRDCVVHVKKYSESVVVIIAYYISADEIDTKELKRFLGKYLPDYMIPNQFMKLTQLPLNTNGKIDRKALPEPSNFKTHC